MSAFHSLAPRPTGRLSLSASEASRLPLRIGLLCEYFYPESAGGTGTVLSNLARSLKESHPNLEIEVLTSTSLYRCEANHLATDERWEGIRILRLPTPRPSRRSIPLRLGANFLFSSAVLAKLLTRPRYDLLVVATAPPALPLAAHGFRRLTRTPYLYVLYDLYPDIATALNMLPRRLPAAGLCRRLQRSWLHASGRTIVLGRCMEDYLVRHYGMPREQIEVIPIGADPEQVYPMERSTRFRSRHGLQNFVVLHAGNLGRHQDFDTLLDAARLLHEEAPEITFAFVGEGAKKEHILARTGREGLTNVRLFPFVPPEELADMLASADVALVTLERGAEGLGVPSKFYNILASGRPSVALVAPECEVARVQAEAQCGIRLDPGDPARLAAVLRQLARSPLEVERLGGNARRVLVERYTTRHVADRFYASVTEVIESQRDTAVERPARRPVPHPRRRAAPPT
jgi:glycosyltransferase involved in cell wall biosynthesis